MMLKDCDRCLVYTPDGGRLAEARVEFIKDKCSLFFNTYHLKDCKFKTRVDFYDMQKGLVIAYCLIIIRRNPAFPNMVEPWTADCDILEVKNVVQRQKDVRAKVKLEMMFSSEKHGSFFGVIENLSAGGFFVTTGQALEKDEKITFSYVFKRLERKFEAMAIRASSQPDGKYGYGCIFLNLTDGADAAIRSYVYKVLLKKRNKNNKSQEIDE
ncbi:MAG: PilZ domain-containing protein [Lachnospiraceae bacterium]